MYAYAVKLPVEGKAVDSQTPGRWQGCQQSNFRSWARLSTVKHQVDGKADKQSSFRSMAKLSTVKLPVEGKAVKQSSTRTKAIMSSALAVKCLNVCFLTLTASIYSSLFNTHLSLPSIFTTHLSLSLTSVVTARCTKPYHRAAHWYHTNKFPDENVKE